MNKIGIFFGSDTGNTESMANLLYDVLKPYPVVIHDISSCIKKDLESFSILLFGVPTWYYGEMQSDWEDFLPILKKINFNQKIIGFFGCGDQEDYSEYFCDAIGLLYKKIYSPKIKFIGQWSTKGYSFINSQAMVNNDFFYGLTLDQDRQPEKSLVRIKKWVNQITNEIYLIEKNNVII
ncbi:Flavodoxin 1 [Buchnera aphidicola (Eriosoma grossulariae)]|uniref:flavodoxin n=1 Tax=Buchnera aphidicola TaxID=9 RepID=UPI003463EED5